ncbi:MAG: ParB N-terminal domain-containing protein, partial [Planctomycetota bacterium]|nr:ParB N-terminal domain-containing protein [Planctomycetota bacterium]
MIDPIEVCDFFRPGAQTTEIFKIQPSPENAAIYRKRTTKDTDFRRLVVSIEENGVQTPLLVSRDGYVISGHQRLAAAQEAGLTEVPIIVLDKHRYEYSVDEWVGILREHNVGREKTLDERIREEIVDIDPDEAMDAVINDQINRSRPKSNTVSVPLGRKTRSKITSSRPFADAVRGILTGILKSALPVPERAIHYHLLPLGVRTSTSKNGRIYQNDTKSLKALSNILTRMRLNGEIPWEWISDETRPVSNWKAWPDAAAFLGEELETLYSGFARNLMCSQSTYYEIILEKLTIRGFIDKVAARYTIPTVTLRGNSGIDARHKLAERFRASGKKSLVLFIL